jgi:hypothetical protein
MGGAKSNKSSMGKPRGDIMRPPMNTSAMQNTMMPQRPASWTQTGGTGLPPEMQRPNGFLGGMNKRVLF